MKATTLLIALYIFGAHGFTFIPHSRLLPSQANFKSEPIGSDLIRSSPSLRNLSRLNAKYGPFSSVPSEDSNFMDSDAFDKFDEWVGSQGNLKSSRESEFKFVLEELKAFIEERTGREEGEVTVVMDEEMTRGMAEVVSRKVHVLLSMRGVEGVDLMKACIEEAGEDGGLTSGLISFIIDFLEEFVSQSASLDSRNTQLLGSLIDFVRSNNDVAKVEEFFDGNVEELDGNFMAHLSRQEKRLLSSPSATVETAKLLDMFKVIKVLVMDAQGRALSEGGDVAVIVNQLLQYDDDETRVQVMRAGLEARDAEWKQQFFEKIEEVIGETEGIKSDDGREMRRRLETLQKNRNEFL
ncbi:hypothetical protein TrLO_g15505 [Triparma laevis f. longispina]|uniref:Uncharacterized protein n=1 Tax=Triparma laevis f. longispina TaxID=1714387 RepID=A0A9W6ZF74_9STRA|nr:hypothetical protein TrLO_g15505 [Triparma laevis f. longispina]